MFLLVAHFRSGAVDAAPADDHRAPRDGSTPAGSGSAADRAAVALLAAQPTTRWVRWAGSTEEAGHRVLVAEFDSAADYRRALSPFDVRTTVVAWLSGAQISTSGVFEVEAAAGAGEPAGVLAFPEVTVPEPGR